MRTTIDLPDDLFRQAKARAALSGIKLKDLIARYVEQGLRQGESVPPAQPRQRSSLPVISKAASGQPIPALSNAETQAILDEEDAERVLRSAGR
jgi:hypothetical protein